MKCARHPMSEALGICQLCRRGICEACAVNLLNLPHCKECAGYIHYQMTKSPGRPPRLPLPRGTPSKILFIVGGIGSLIMMVGGFCVGYFLFFEWGLGGLHYYPWELVAFVLIFSIGMAMTGVGFYGIYWNYGSTPGLVSSILMAINLIISPVITILSIQRTWGFGGEYTIGEEIIVSFVFIGICFLLMGLNLLHIRNYTMLRGLSITAATMTLITGTFFCFAIFAAIGFAWFAGVLANILITLVLLNARLPPYSSPHTKAIFPENAKKQDTLGSRGKDNEAGK